MKTYRYLLFFFIFFIFNVLVVNANMVEKIDIVINIDHNGNANVTEEWDAIVDAGTELYHPYYNIGNAVITDLKVSMDGTEYETLWDWNVNSSLEDKAYKAAIYKPSSDEYDICVGISEYGQHKYTLNYTIEGMIAKLADADMLYWNLFPRNFNASPGNVYITIYGDFDTSNLLGIYGYGKEEASFSSRNNSIYITSNGRVSKDEYITLLVGFPLNTFNTSNIINNKFAYYEEVNNVLKTEEKDEVINTIGGTKKNNNDSKLFILQNIFFGLLIVIIPIFIILLKRNSNTVKDDRRYVRGYLKCVFGKDGNKIPKDVDYYRDIPNNKDIYRSFWICGNYGLLEKREDFMGAILLKWLLNGNIKFNEDNDIELLKQPDNKEMDLENRLYTYLIGASKSNKLKKEDFKYWCRNNSSIIYHWFTDVIDYETVLLEKEGKAKFVKEDNAYHSVHYEVDNSMIEEAKKIAGLKKYLNYFSLMHEKEKIEVKLWKEYLIYSQMFGMADKISKQFRELYPELLEIINDSGFDIDDLNLISASCTNIIKMSDIIYENTDDLSSRSSRERDSNYSSDFSSSSGSFSSHGGNDSFGSGGSNSSGGGFR